MAPNTTCHFWIYREFFLLCWFERFSKWANNNKLHRQWRRHFLKNKTKKNILKLTCMKQKLAFSWCTLSLRFSLFLYCTSDGVYPTVIKGDISEGLSNTFNQWGTNPGPMEKLSSDFFNSLFYINHFHHFKNHFLP